MTEESPSLNDRPSSLINPAPRAGVGVVGHGRACDLLNPTVLSDLGQRGGGRGVVCTMYCQVQRRLRCMTRLANAHRVAWPSAARICAAAGVRSAHPERSRQVWDNQARARFCRANGSGDARVFATVQGLSCRVDLPCVRIYTPVFPHKEPVLTLAVCCVFGRRQPTRVAPPSKKRRSGPRRES